MNSLALLTITLIVPCEVWSPTGFIYSLYKASLRNCAATYEIRNRYKLGIAGVTYRHATTLSVLCLLNHV